MSIKQPGHTKATSTCSSEVISAHVQCHQTLHSSQHTDYTAHLVYLPHHPRYNTVAFRATTKFSISEKPATHDSWKKKLQLNAACSSAQLKIQSSQWVNVLLSKEQNMFAWLVLWRWALLLESSTCGIFSTSQSHPSFLGNLFCRSFFLWTFCLYDTQTYIYNWTSHQGKLPRRVNLTLQGVQKLSGNLAHSHYVELLQPCVMVVSWFV